MLHIYIYTKNQLPKLPGPSLVGVGWGGRWPNFFLHISSSWVKIRLHTKNQLPMLPGPPSVGVGVRWPQFFKNISSSWVKIMLHTKNQLPRLSEVPFFGGVVIPEVYILQEVPFFYPSASCWVPIFYPRFQIFHAPSARNFQHFPHIFRVDPPHY